MNLALELYIDFVIFLFGITIGSFANVCIWRIPQDKSVVLPPSACPKCGTKIRWYDNIPLVSYMLLWGRCRVCKEKISLRYPFVELLTGIVFLLIYLKYGASLITIAYLLFATGLIISSFIDIDYMIIPDRFSIGGMIAGLLISTLLPALHNSDLTKITIDNCYIGFKLSLIGLIIGTLLLFFVAKIGSAFFKKEAMGLGDVKLLGAIGAFTGWQGVIFTVMFSSVIGALCGISFVLFGNKKMGSRIPFGPYLALSAILWILAGKELWNWYFKWLMR
jgi:leader peptidase (prepilin peptidase)/N-methyltransferase